MTTGSQELASIALTDDEVAALSLRLEVEWISPLPSLVDVDDRGTEQAAARGWRSLSVRNLVGAGELGPGLHALLQPVLRQGVFVRTFLASPDGVVPLLGTFFTAYKAGSADLLVEVTSGNGIHVFEQRSTEQVRTLITAALEEVFVHGIDVPGGWPSAAARPDSLCAVSSVSGRNLVLVVTRAATRLLQVDGQTDTEVGANMDVVDALAQLLSPDTRRGMPSVDRV